MTLAYARALVARHRALALLAFLIGLPLILAISYVLPRTYAASASLLLTNQKPDASNELTTVLTSLAKSSSVLERVRATTNDAVPMAVLQQNVKARLYGTILKISYTDSHAALAVAVPNAVVDSLVAYYNNLASEQYGSSTARLQVELERKKQQLNDLDRRFQALSAAGVPVDAENAAGSAELSSSLAALQAQRIGAEDTLRSDLAYAGSGPGATGPLQADVSNNPEYATLEGSLQRDETLLAAQQRQYTADFPGVADTSARVTAERNQLATLRARLLGPGSAANTSGALAAQHDGRTTALLSADHAKLDAIDAQIASLEGRSNRLAGSRVTIETLKAERDSVVAQFSALSASLATALASRAIAENYGTLSVIDRATYADVAGLNWKIVALLDIVIALALAFAACAIAERLDPEPVAKDLEASYGRSSLRV